MKIYDISQEILSSNVYPGDPSPKLNKILEFEKGDACNLSELTMCLHNGTHIDAPVHFVHNGSSIDMLDLQIFLGKCQVVSVHNELVSGEDIENIVKPGCKRLIIKGNGKSSLTPYAATELIEMGVKLIGIDNQTIGAGDNTEKVHQILLQNDIYILEGLMLNGVNDGDYFLVSLPLKIQGADGSPCRAILFQN